MAAPRLLRALPSLVVGALVVAAAAAQSGPGSPLRRLLPAPGGTFASPAASAGGSATRRDGAAPAAANATTCLVITPTATTGRPPLATVWQPDAVTATASGLSFTLLSGSGAPATFTAELAFFDPNSTDPRLSSYPLHRSTLTASGSGLETFACPIDRPIVIRSLEGSPVTTTAALALRSDWPDPVEDAYEPNGPARFRPAMYDAGPLGIVPLPGPNPVLAHEVCGEMDAGDGLHVVRQLIASTTTRTADLEMVQTFETAVTATAEWIELAVAAPPGSSAPLDVRIFELGGTVPLPDPLPTTATAAVMEGVTLSPPVWGATVPLAEAARLEPGRRYALAIVCDGTWSFGAAEAPDGAAYEGGELWTRNGSSGPFTLDSDRDLSFRVIGRPVTQTAEPEWPVCDGVLSRSSTLTASMPLPNDRVVVQPLTIKGDDFGIGSVSLLVGGPITVPAEPDLGFALAPFGAPPAPNQIALRSASPVSPCACPVVGPRELLFTTPLVTTPLEGVAQGAGQQLVMALRGRTSTLTADVGYDEASSLPIPPALYRDPGMAWLPLPGPHPVVAHQVCPATPTAAGPWRVAQQLLQSDGVFPGTATATLLQSFRVPSTVQVSWAELGMRFGGSPTHTAVPVRLLAPGPSTQTVEPEDGFDLGAMLVPITITANPIGSVPIPALHASSPLPAFVTLTAGVDYWIGVTTTAELDYAYAEASPYTEGRLFRSPSPGALPVEETDRDLAFRLIGVPRELMAGPATPTCNGCASRAFEAVTVTADFHGATFTARSFGQVLPITTTPILESVQLPLGADGGAVTITADLRFTETDALGRVRPRDDSYPLHSVTITASAGDMRWGQAFFDRPLVMRGWGGGTPTGTAEVGILVHAPDAGAKGRAKLALGDEAVCTCTALLERSGSGGGGGGGWSPMPGLAMGHVLHGVTTTADLDLYEMTGELNVHGVTITAMDVVQSFRVPTPTRVEWLELAVPAGQAESPPFEVSIVDPAGLAVPPAGPLGVTTTAEPLGFSESMRHGGTWAPTERFSAPPVLQPGRDYWLVARVPAEWSLARAVTATATHGPRLYTRPPGDGDWTEEPAGALSFRVIGAETNPVDVPVAANPRGLRLSASPQPFRHELSLRWLGGGGRMTIEIFDERGRRVREVRDAGAAVYGAWTWRGEDDSGRRVGAGVYFVRATPGAGPAVRQRVVFLR